MKKLLTIVFMAAILIGCNNCSSGNVRIFISSDKDEIITDIIQRAIESCSSAGGGTVYFPAGKYLTGEIRLTWKVLHICRK